MSEVLGRRRVFITTYSFFTVFNAAASASQDVWTLIILRFLAGSGFCDIMVLENVDFVFQDRLAPPLLPTLQAQLQISFQPKEEVVVWPFSRLVCPELSPIIRIS